MAETRQRSSRPAWRRELRGVFVVAKKDAMVYYVTPQVFIFGVLFPVFFFLVFTTGRRFTPAEVMPGMLAMALFFTASVVGPLVTPWERRSKTYERLISSPVSQLSIILGDVLAGAVFGALLSVVPWALGSAFTDASLRAPLLLPPAILLSAMCFASLGVLVAAAPTQNPGSIMMLSNLVRLPLVFISGVFVPLTKETPLWGKVIAPLSPLSYCTDLVRTAYGAESFFPLWLDFAMIALFTAVFVGIAWVFHRRAREKAL